MTKSLNQEAKRPTVEGRYPSGRVMALLAAYHPMLRYCCVFMPRTRAESTYHSPYISAHDVHLWEVEDAWYAHLSHSSEL